MEKEIKAGLRHVYEEKLEAALITVTKVLGSAPRKPGAQMLVLADGTTWGTIGGGCGEADARQVALHVLATGKARKHFLNMTADRVICNDFEKALSDLVIDSYTYVVIVTRGHRHDKVCLKKVIHEPAGYIGMIGSRRRVKAMLAELLEEGIPAEKLEKLYSPIGLKIGAETPEEIALCILAEIIKVQKEQNEMIIIGLYIVQ